MTSTATLFTNIGELRTVSDLGTLHDAALVAEDGIITWVGAAADAPACDTQVDLEGRAVLPGWVDSHTHMIFDGDRAAEFEARMAGQDYAAGGIAITMNATRAASPERLRELLDARVHAAHLGGTTSLETKTGYGLDVESEALAAQLAAEAVGDVTFLGAHVVPPGADPEDYVDLVTGDMLDAVAPHVQWIDVFCERGAFTEDQSRRVLRAGQERGLGVRVHGNQLGEGAGVALAVELGAAAIVPVEMHRSVVRLDEKKAAVKQKRWQAIAEAAAKQAGRSVIPEVSLPLSFKEALRRVEAEGTELRLLPYERAAGMAATRDLIRSVKAGQRVAVMIGPEGGFEETEVEAAEAEGFRALTLGKRILRTETAGLVMLSLVMAETEED